MEANVDYEITEEDQNKIIEFSVLHDKRLKSERKLKILSQQLTSLQDAQDEALISMEPPLLKIGDCFMKLTDDELECELEKDKLRLESEISTLKEEISELKTKSRNLKSLLYAKFGNKINLET